METPNLLIRAIFFLIIGLVFFSAMIYGILGKPPYGFFIGGYISFTSLFIARLLFGTWRYRRLLYISKVIGFIGSLNYLLVFGILWIQNSTIKKNDIKLIGEIKQFKIKEGKYPNNLNDLTPKYIQEIPNLWTGLVKKEYAYQYFPPNASGLNNTKYNNQNDGGNFILSYRSFFGEIWMYNNKIKSWRKI